MRSRNALRNVITSLCYEGFIVLMGLIVPRLIISTYGSNINGLTSTINQVLQIINLLQAGAVGASIFQMFKPVADEDYETISKILYSSKMYFRKLGYIFLLLIVIAGPLFSMVYCNENITYIEALLAFILLGLNGSLYFFYTAYFDILFSSHQKRFVLSVSGLLGKVVYYGFLLLVVLTKGFFILMYVAAICGTIVNIIFLYWFYKRTYKNKIRVIAKGSVLYPIPNKGYLLCNQICTQATDCLPTVLLSLINGLSYASIYAVYNLVQNMMKMLINTIQQSISEVFGNLVVSSEDEKIADTYNLIEVMFFIIGLFLCTCASSLFIPFIFQYTGHNTFDVNYMFPVLSLLIVLYAVIYSMYMPIYTLSNVLGLYRETYKQSIVVSVK